MRIVAILALIAFLSAVPVGTGVSGDPSPGSQGAGTSDPALEEFVPTEEVPADSAIAFPVDI